MNLKDAVGFEPRRHRDHGESQLPDEFASKTHHQRGQRRLHQRPNIPALCSLCLCGSIAFFKTKPWSPFVRTCVVSVAALLLGVAAGCSKRETAADLDPQTVTAFTDMNIMVALFEGLTVLDERTSKPLPGAAESWSCSPDGLTWTFHLRPGARWSDGAPLTAEDFVYSFKRILSPHLASEYAYMLWPLKNARALNEGTLKDFSKLGARAIDANTLELDLAEPCPWLLTLVSNQPWFPVPRQAIERWGTWDQRGTAWTRPGHLVCNGPFKLLQWQPGVQITVERNPDYWDAYHTKLNRIVFFPHENITSEESAFRTGQRHMTYELSPERIATYRREAPQELRIDPLYETFFLRLNVKRPPLNNPEVRRALALAIDRAAICRSVLQGSRLPAPSMTPPGADGYVSKAGIAYDPSEARRLLAEAGYPGGKGFPQLEIQFKSDDIHRATMEAVQQMWRKQLGITTVLTSLEQTTWLDNQRTLSYQITSSRWVGDYLDPNTFLDLWVGDNGKNETGWSNPAYDVLIRQAARTLDGDKRHALQQRAESLLLEQCPVVPIFYGARVYLISPAVHHWAPALLGLHRFQLVELREPADAK